MNEVKAMELAQAREKRISDDKDLSRKMDRMVYEAKNLPDDDDDQRVALERYYGPLKPIELQFLSLHDLGTIMRELSNEFFRNVHDELGKLFKFTFESLTEDYDELETKASSIAESKRLEQQFNDDCDDYKYSRDSLMRLQDALVHELGLKSFDDINFEKDPPTIEDYV